MVRQKESGLNARPSKKNSFPPRKSAFSTLSHFAELVRGYDHEKGVEFTPQEMSAVLRLLVLGGYTETKTYCAFGRSLSHTSGEGLEKTVRNWGADTI